MGPTGQAQTPLIDLLRSVPADARMTYEVSECHHHMIPVGRLCADAVAELAALRARAEKAEQFRDAVIDALVVSHIYIPEHDTNPRKAINDLICWEQKIALDPLVSSDARALIERAVAGCAEDCAIQVAAREKAEQENARLREAAEAPLPTKDDLMQSVYALERAEQDLRRLAERLMNQRDYSAEFPAADADSIARLLPLLHAIARGDLVVCVTAGGVWREERNEVDYDYTPAREIPEPKT